MFHQFPLCTKMVQLGNSWEQMALQPLHCFPLRAWNHVGVDGKCDARVRMPQLCLSHGNRHTQLRQQSAVQMPERVPAEPGNAQPVPGGYPPGVGKLREEVRAAEGIILGTPEYHGGFSGVLKNALDLMGFDEFEGKMMGLVGVSGRKTMPGGLEWRQPRV